MNKVDFKTSPYFSGIFIFLGIFLALIGLPLLFTSIVGAMILLLLSLIIFTTHYRLSIDFDTKTFHDYVWFLGFKNGEKGKFEQVEYVFVKKSAISQKMQLKAANSTIRKEVYDGYLKFSEEEKIHLLTKDNKQDVVKKLREISTMLNVKIIDYSRGEADEI
jgi:hypothetical protein